MGRQNYARFNQRPSLHHALSSSFPAAFVPKKKARRVSLGEGYAAGQCMPGLLRLPPSRGDGLFEPFSGGSLLARATKNPPCGGLRNPSHRDVSHGRSHQPIGG